MHLATDTKKIIGFKDARDLVITTLRDRLGRFPIEEEISGELRELFNTESIEKIVLDEISCDIEKDSTYSSKAVQKIMKNSVDYFRGGLFNKNIKNYINNYITWRIRNVKLQNRKPEFTVVYDPGNHSNQMKTVEPLRFPVLNPEINPRNYLIINRNDILDDLFHNQSQNQSQKPWGFRPPEMYDFAGFRNTIKKYASEVRDFYGIYDFEAKNSRLLKKYTNVLFSLYDVADYVVGLLLKKGFQKNLNICYVYQKLNIYEMSCILDKLYVLELINYNVQIFLPIPDFSNYQDTIFKELIQLGRYSSTKYVQTLYNRSYNVLVYTTLFMRYPIFLYVAKPEYKVIPVIRDACIIGSDLEFIKNYPTDNRIGLFLGLLCEIEEIMKKPGSRPDFDYDKSRSPEENMKGLSPEIQAEITKLVSEETAKISRIPIPVSPVFEIIVGPMGSGKSRYNENIRSRYSDIYSIEPDAIAFRFPNYEKEKSEAISELAKKYNSEVGIWNKSGNDVLFSTLSLILGSHIHMNFVNYGWAVYFKSMEAAISRRINILTELTFKSKDVFENFIEKFSGYKVRISVIHTRFDQQYFNQLKRSLTESRFSPKIRILHSTNQSFNSIYEILLDPKYKDIDIYFYDNTDYNIENPKNLLLRRESGIIECINEPNTLPIETGIIDLFRNICSRMGGSESGVLFGILIFLVILLMIILIHPGIPESRTRIQI